MIEYIHTPYSGILFNRKGLETQAPVHVGFIFSNTYNLVAPHDADQDALVIAARITLDKLPQRFLVFLQKDLFDVLQIDLKLKADKVLH